MRAPRMTAPAADSSATQVVEVDEPRPGPGEVAIEVAFAGVNFIDVMARRGDPGSASGWPYVAGLVAPSWQSGQGPGISQASRDR
jgi:NADPH:quinone reductase